ncbi:MAG TPA: hypothetical protein VM347_41665 [Nonomuraea sp.]|nr:hypothetical protein [Nonomuraea sp.]
MAVAQSRASSSKELSLDLPLLSIKVRPPDLRMPHVGMPHLELPRISRQEVGHAVDVARTLLPPPDRIAYYGALGVLAAFGVLEWPVAAAIGAGTLIARRGRQGESGSPARRAQGSPAAVRPRTTATATTSTAAPKRAAGSKGATATAAPKSAAAPKGGAASSTAASKGAASKGVTATADTSTKASSRRKSAASATPRGGRKSTAGRARSGG